MKFSDILILAVILGGGYSYFFSKEKMPTLNEQLITQFDKHDVVGKNQWEKGKVIDGVQVYAVRKDYTVYQSLWNLGVKDAGVIVMSAGEATKIDAAFALSQCNQLAKAVTDNESTTITDAVFSIFQRALAADKDKDGILRSSGNVDGKVYDVSARVIGPALTFTCGIKTA